MLRCINKSETREWDFLMQANHEKNNIISFTNGLTKLTITILIIVIIIMAIILVAKIIRKR